VAEEETKSEIEPYRVRLPGFLSDKDIGLGDAIKRVTYAVGIRPSAGCEHRGRRAQPLVRLHRPGQVTHVRDPILKEDHYGTRSE